MNYVLTVTLIIIIIIVNILFSLLDWIRMRTATLWNLPELQREDQDTSDSQMTHFYLTFSKSDSKFIFMTLLIFV